MDYAYFYKDVILDRTVNNIEEYDILISGYDPCPRIIEPFNAIKAKEKHWLIFPQYGIDTRTLPTEGHIFFNESVDESIYVTDFLNRLDLNDFKKICIDITVE